MRAKKRMNLQKRALRLMQDKGRPIYQFTLTAAELFQIADVSRVSRDDAGKLIGYQRPEVKRHVQDIINYLDSGQVLFPNSLILALSPDVKFARSRGPQKNYGAAVSGILSISIPKSEASKPAWIVDGQQRALALSKCKRQGLSVPINAFIADNVDTQRDQFLRINNTRPLPRGLITELLPEVTCPLPAKLSVRQVPARLCELLNTNKTSPFKGLIRRSSNKKEAQAKAHIADSSICDMISESLSNASGCLFPYRNLATGETDFDAVWSVLITYWAAVRTTFSDAWGRSPQHSRLMHGAGIRAMGRLMDRIMGSLNVGDPMAMRRVQRELAIVKHHCRWTSGTWEELNLNWNEVQNVPRHIGMLSSFLVRMYVRGKEQAP